MDTVIAKGDNPFIKFNQLKLYEICYSRVNNTFPRVNLVKSSIAKFPETLQSRTVYTLRKNERDTGLSALKQLTNTELKDLKENLNFDLEALFTKESIEQLFKPLPETQTSLESKLPFEADAKLVQRLRRKYKRENRIL